MGVLFKPAHQKIFSLFLERQELSYAEIARGARLKSNLLNYYLRDLLSDGLLEKHGSTYRVSKQAEYFIPFFQQMVGGERLKLPVILIAIVNRGKVLLIQRQNRPYKGYWSLPGGKIRYDESLVDAARRICEKETHLPIDVTHVCALIDERVKEEEHVKHGWFIFLVKAKARQLPMRMTGDWFATTALDGKIIPSDKWMIQHALRKKTNVTNVIIEEKDGKIVDFKRS